jgi:hypothetical protein
MAQPGRVRSVPARPPNHKEVEMAVGSDTAVAAQERIAAPQQQADLARSALPDAPVEADRTRRETDLLDHLRQVQRKEQVPEAHQRTRWAHRHAGWVLWSAGIGLLLAVIALATG